MFCSRVRPELDVCLTATLETAKQMLAGPVGAAAVTSEIEYMINRSNTTADPFVDLLCYRVPEQAASRTLGFNKSKVCARHRRSRGARACFISLGAPSANQLSNHRRSPLTTSPRYDRPAGPRHPPRRRPPSCRPSASWWT